LDIENERGHSINYLKYYLTYVSTYKQVYTAMNCRDIVFLSVIY